MSREPRSPISVWRPISTDTFLLGAPHYPEHVDESYWERDAERMSAAGFNATRMGEFAWHIFEPREGQFDFDLFDRAIEVLGRHGIKTIMCTPTATPPRWLTANYPEVLRVDGDGRPASHGSRQHADTASPVYRTHSKRITARMAEHYKDNPFVIGWQTDNELNTTESRSYSAATRDEFQKFLVARYNSIEQLNSRVGRRFLGNRIRRFQPGRAALRSCSRRRRSRPHPRLSPLPGIRHGAVPGRSGGNPACRQPELVRLPRRGATRGHRLSRAIFTRSRFSRVQHLSPPLRRDSKARGARPRSSASSRRRARVRPAISLCPSSSRASARSPTFRR